MIGDGEWIDNLTRYTLQEYGELISEIYSKINSQGLEEEVSPF
jgi:hypothetical protein